MSVATELFIAPRDEPDADLEPHFVERAAWLTRERGQKLLAVISPF